MPPIAQDLKTPFAGLRQEQILSAYSFDVAHLPLENTALVDLGRGKDGFKPDVRHQMIGQPGHHHSLPAAW